MKIEPSEQWLPVYEALASKVRLKILEILSTETLNIRELAERLQLSSAIMTMHIRKLEKSGLLRVEAVPSKGGLQKKCYLNIDELVVNFSALSTNSRKSYKVEMPIGHFSECEIHPTCGLATVESVIGEFDDPRYFADPERVRAGILWLGHGYIDYRVPNPLGKSKRLNEIEISAELASEAPYAQENWPSDITFYLNGVRLGEWTSPGDFADHRGIYTPRWWPSDTNQYGLLKLLRVTDKGTYIDGIKMSDVTIQDIPMDIYWKLRFEVKSTAENVGGLTLYGSGFGNYNQDIVFRFYYLDSALSSSNK